MDPLYLDSGGNLSPMILGERLWRDSRVESCRRMVGTARSLGFDYLGCIWIYLGRRYDIDEAGRGLCTKTAI